MRLVRLVAAEEIVVREASIDGPLERRDRGQPARFMLDAVALNRKPAAPTNAIATAACSSAASRASSAPRRNERSFASM